MRMGRASGRPRALQDRVATWRVVVVVCLCAYGGGALVYVCVYVHTCTQEYKFEVFDCMFMYVRVRVIVCERVCVNL